MAAARKAKRRLENPLTEAQKVEKFAAEAERQRKFSGRRMKSAKGLG